MRITCLGSDGAGGKPKKTWSKVVEEDMRQFNITEDVARVDSSGGSSYHVQPQEWETRKVKQRR